jgi:ferredoxin-type protein NapG
MARHETSRREVLARTLRGLGVAAVAGSVWGYALETQSRAAPFALRPPGALPEDDFVSTCIKCGQCAAACPYDTLRIASLGASVPLGTPFFRPRRVPCYMCPDLPCTRACPTGALSADLGDVEDADMGVAVLVDQENCLSYRGLRCEICYRECPLQNRAISVRNYPRGTSKHALFVPVVHGDECTGCGVCEKVCPLPEATIRVLPRALGRGKPGEHYRFSAAPEQRNDAAAPGKPKAPDIASGLRYLNEDGL